MVIDDQQRHGLTAGKQPRHASVHKYPGRPEPFARHCAFFLMLEAPINLSFANLGQTGPAGGLIFTIERPSGTPWLGKIHQL
jgi:hypothetical protein